MANEEQLALLKKSVKEWNEWREKKRYVKVDLIEADLSEAHLGGADLTGLEDLRGLRGYNVQSHSLRP